MYTTYVAGFPELLNTFYRLCRTSSQFAEFLKSRQQHPNCHGLDLAALLLSPVQRVPRYLLLLQQLLRRTPPEHADHGPLQTALQALREFLARLDHSMENSLRLVKPREAAARERDNRVSKPARRAPGLSKAAFSAVLLLHSLTLDDP
ncbi:guanine exchange factor for Rac 30-like [Pollicipes pollicipes]|uniref:guanine exchange factor for Rac 30-like n=1 Tax=Pollicipes pollicipes TaxID=41117 RepID=UPI0018859674|nr:guanine exchange factor for Rac 30-like [Pollicipes pollicipes]